MGYIAKNWREVKNSILSQKFLDRVRPEATLKNKIDGAGKKIECQILRLEQTHNKLKQNNDLEKPLPNSTQDNVFKGDSHQGQNINLTI